MPALDVCVCVCVCNYLSVFVCTKAWRSWWDGEGSESNSCGQTLGLPVIVDEVRVIVLVIVLVGGER